MNKEESFEDYKKRYIKACVENIPWRKDSAVEMFSAFPVHTELMYTDLRDKYEAIIAEKDKTISEQREVLIDAGSRSHRSEKLYHWYCKLNNNAKPPTQTISMNKWLDNEDKVKDLEKLLAEKDKQLEELLKELKREREMVEKLGNNELAFPQAAARQFIANRRLDLE